MAQAPTSWWDQFGDYANKYGPGMLGIGANIAGQLQTGKQQRQMLGELRGPQYATEQALAARAYGQAGSMDPKAVGAERYAAQQELMAPGEEQQRQELMRQLQAKGMLGLSSYQPVPGVISTPGQPMNPYMASLLAAQQTQRAKSAYQSLNEGELQLDRLLQRGSSLSAPGRAATANAAQQNILAPKPSISQLLLKGGSSLLQNKQAQQDIWNLLKKGGGMLTGMFGGPSSYDALSGRNFASEDYYDYQ